MSAFIRHLADTVPPPLRGWATDAQLEAGARDFLAPLWTRLDDRALAEEFFHYCPIAGARADDYFTRALTLPGHGEVWAGIRFKGGDLTWPFLEVATTFDVDTAALARLKPLLAETFAVFRPGWLRLWRFGTESPWPDARPDNTYFVAPVAEIQAIALGEPPRLSVMPATDLDWYDTFKADHAAYMAAHPELANEVRFETHEDLDACLQAGLLFEARLEGAIAGVIAFGEEPFFGLPGYLVLEEFLLAPYRGRGLGPWLQSLAARHLAADHLLFGTIHALNTPSQRTAARNGRLPILSSYFVPLDPGTPRA